MAVPFRRTSKTKKRMRRTHLKKSAPTVSLCPKCNAPIKPHRVCLKCGYYKGQEVIKQNVEEEKEIKKEEAPKKEKKTKIKKEDTK